MFTLKIEMLYLIFLFLFPYEHKQKNANFSILGSKRANKCLNINVITIYFFKTSNRFGCHHKKNPEKTTVIFIQGVFILMCVQKANFSQNYFFYHF